MSGSMRPRDILSTVNTISEQVSSWVNAFFCSTGAALARLELRLKMLFFRIPGEVILPLLCSYTFLGSCSKESMSESWSKLNTLRMVLVMRSQQL